MSQQSRQKRVQRRRDEINREMSANRRAAGLGHVSGLRTHQDAMRLMARIPQDTRDLTARICGDPLPGRRAIDRRSA